mmetsp:Transcript_47201/g.75798  ORF Transcript_47201/g.75798 Transcript_47201/m.75798 type:complete len:303 (+) Transcript_47201:403-1311(+)
MSFLFDANLLLQRFDDGLAIPNPLCEKPRGRLQHSICDSRLQVILTFLFCIFCAGFAREKPLDALLHPISLADRKIQAVLEVHVPFSQVHHWGGSLLLRGELFLGRFQLFPSQRKTFLRLSEFLPHVRQAPLQLFHFLLGFLASLLDLFPIVNGAVELLLQQYRLLVQPRGGLLRCRQIPLSLSLLAQRVVPFFCDDLELLVDELIALLIVPLIKAAAFAVVDAIVATAACAALANVLRGLEDLLARLRQERLEGFNLRGACYGILFLVAQALLQSLLLRRELGKHCLPLEAISSHRLPLLV